jgi:murein DD-endopeptidase MepM/ murein hydrolase activator NlpD
VNVHTKNKNVVHTGAMRRGVCFLVLGVLASAVAAASAHADGTGTNPGTTTTTTGTTTTTPTPTYGPLGTSYLPASCVGAGAATIAVPGRNVLALGTPASSLGAAGYPAGKAPLVGFGSSYSSGSTCKTAHVSLQSVSLLSGAVTATSVQATAGRGSVYGLQIEGSPAALGAGQMTALGNWGQLWLGRRVGRLAAPLVLELLAPRDGLPAGTTITVAFAASALPPVKSKPTPHSSESTPQPSSKPPAKSSQSHAQPKQAAKKHRRHKKRKPVPQPLTVTPPLGFRPSHYVFPVATGADYGDTYGGVRNDIYDGWHHGDDLFAALGTPVVAVANGKLSLVGWNQLGGWRLWLTDGDGNSFYYAHLAAYSRWVLTHRNVRAGEVVGFLGRTGDAFTTSPHLHFEIHPQQFLNLGYDGAVDPTSYLKKWRVVTVPEKEMPNPAKLKAPIGTPTQEATVVWNQLLVARHLLPVVTSAAGHRAFPQPRTVEASGLKLASPSAPLAEAAPAAAHVAISRSDAVPWVGASVFGAAVVLSVGGAGAFAVRRRRRPREEASS